MRLSEHIWATLHKIRCAEWMDFAYKNLADNLVMVYEQELLNFVYDLQEDIDAATAFNVVDVFLDDAASSHALLRFVVLLPTEIMTEEEIDLYPEIENAASKVERVTVDATPTFFGAPDIDIARTKSDDDPQVDAENEELRNAFAEALMVEYESIEEDDE